LVYTIEAGKSLNKLKVQLGQQVSTCSSATYPVTSKGTVGTFSISIVLLEVQTYALPLNNWIWDPTQFGPPVKVTVNTFPSTIISSLVTSQAIDSIPEKTGEYKLTKNGLYLNDAEYLGGNGIVDGDILGITRTRLGTIGPDFTTDNQRSLMSLESITFSPNFVLTPAFSDAVDTYVLSGFTGAQLTGPITITASLTNPSTAKLSARFYSNAYSTYLTNFDNGGTSSCGNLLSLSSQPVVNHETIFDAELAIQLKTTADWVNPVLHNRFIHFHYSTTQ